MVRIRPPAIRRPLDLVDRVWATWHIAAVSAIVATSTIPLSVWWFDGIPAEVLTAAFLVLLAGVAVRPGRPRWTAATGIVGFVWFTGRALAFGSAAMNGSTNLAGSAVSAGAQAVTIGALCTISIFRVVYQRHLNRGINQPRSPRGEPRP